MTVKQKSLLVFLLLTGATCITALWGNKLAASTTNIRVWDWLNVLILLLGIPFILLQNRAGLPELMQPGIPEKKRYFLPFFVGLLFGSADVLIIKFILHPQPYNSLPPFLQPFPYSVSLYTSGALEIEIFYRLIPMTLILLAGKWIRKGKYYEVFFWTAAILISLREPLEQWPSGVWWFVVYAAVSGFLMNLLQALYYRKAGFLASLILRLGHYFLWHISLGIYVQYVELTK